MTTLARFVLLGTLAAHAVAAVASTVAYCLYR